MDLKQTINLSVLPPVMSQQQFAAYTGVTDDTVRGWLECKTVPTVKIGRQRFVNVALLVDDLKTGKSIFVRGDYDE